MEQDKSVRDKSLKKWGLKDQRELYTTGMCFQHVADNYLKTT